MAPVFGVGFSIDGGVEKVFGFLNNFIITHALEVQFLQRTRPHEDLGSIFDVFIERDATTVFKVNGKGLVGLIDSFFQ